MEFQAHWLSIAPPAVAILVALLLRSVIPALFLGVWLGAALIHGGGGLAWIEGFFNTLSVHVLGALADEDHAAIILFSMMIGGLVGVIRQSGGLHGVLNWISRHALSRRQAQLSTAGMGVLLFFDDYANSLIVGRTMQPLTRRLKISAEKLAYLVDSTAAPVTAVALISTWIGYQLGLIDDALSGLETALADQSAYGLFLQSLGYSFYPWLCLYLVFRVASSERDFGPMRLAERRALSQQAEAGTAESASERAGPAIYAVAPILVLLLSVIVGLYVTGSGESLSEIFGSASPYQALIWASLLATMIALAAPLLTSGQTLADLLEGWLSGMQSMLLAMIVLVLAWALADVIDQLKAAEFLARTLQGQLMPAVLPALVFVLAASIAFATGTSWGTMGILIPLVIPLAANLAPTQLHILQAGLAAVLAGAIWGDHCSPISDTTILSSLACGCDHLEHVRTQLPYALSAGGVALIVGFIPAGFGVPALVSLVSGALVLECVLRRWGRSP